MSPRSKTKQRMTLTISKELIAEARVLGINASSAAESDIAAAVKTAKECAWDGGAGPQYNVVWPPGRWPVPISRSTPRWAVGAVVARAGDHRGQVGERRAAQGRQV